MLLPGSSNHKTPVFFYISLGAVAFIGAVASWYVYTTIDRTGREHILDRAHTVAELISVNDLALLAGNASDVGTAPYERLKQTLMKVREVNHDSRFVYLIGREAGGELFFFADSEEASSSDYSPPGQIYSEATPSMTAVLTDGVARVEGPDRDRWGSWISAYAPIRDERGAIKGILGIDLPAASFIQDIAVYSLLPLVIAFSILLFIIAAELFRRREILNLEQKEEFLSIASHEIRTPLQGVSWGLAQLLRSKASLTSEEHTLLTLMHHNTQGLIARLNNLLDIRTLENRAERTFVRELVGIDSLFKDISNTLVLSARERDVTLMIPLMGASAFRADRQMMYHVFYNLVGNAIKYTRPHTTVSVTYVYENGVHEFQIHDQGEGIPDNEREMIFKGYWRGESARTGRVTGTGLGLFMTKKAIALHNGTVEFTSVPGTGTTFTVRIPD